MEIQKEVLGNFVKKICANENADVTLLDFTEDGIRVGLRSTDSITMYIGLIRLNSIANHKAIGKVGIADISFLKDVLNRFSGLLKVTVGKRGMIIKSGTKKVLIALGDANSIEMLKPSEKLKHDFKVKIPVASLKEALKDVEAFESNKFIDFAAEKNCLYITASTSDRVEKIENSIVIEYDGQPLFTRFAYEYIKRVVDSLSATDIVLHLGNDIPIKIEEDSGMITGHFIIAPHILTEDSEKPTKIVEEE